MAGDAAAQIAESNVLVLYNEDQGEAGDGFQIAEYYQQARPGVHLAGISGIDSILTGAFQETVSATDYLEVVRPQILSAIGDIADSVDVIVTTKGMPLRIHAGSQPPDNESLLWKEWSSLESELTRIDSVDTIDKMGDQFIFTGFPELDTTLPANPYYDSGVPFVRAGSDPVNGDIRLASRLDGFSVDTVKNSIDRAQNVYVAPQLHHLVADDSPLALTDQMTDNSGPGPGLVNVANSLNQVIDYDNTTSPVTTSGRPVIGYVSHGIADGVPAGGGGLEPGYIQNQLQFDLADGAVFLTHESWNAFTFDASNSQSQGLVAEWLEAGGTAGLGAVYEGENGPDRVTNEDLLYQALLPAAGALPGETGLSFVEAAWNATRQLSFVNTVIGDPLMKYQAWLPSDSNLDGMVEFDDFYTMQGNWLQAGGIKEGDVDGDGIIDNTDFQILQSNWMASIDPQALAPGETVVIPVLDAETGEPVLSAQLILEANFDGDLDVDSDDLQAWESSFGIDGGGDTDGDGDTDGFDFLTWQVQFAPYTLSSDFNFDLNSDDEDFSIWEASFGLNAGGDTDGDGDTDGADLLTLLVELDFSTHGEVGAAFSLQSSAQVIPEPGSSILWLLFSLAGLMRRVR